MITVTIPPSLGFVPRGASNLQFPPEQQPFIQRKPLTSTTSSSSSSTALSVISSTRRRQTITSASSDPGPSATSSSTATFSTISPIELWTVTHLESLYTDSTRIKCPFFRRRASDILEGLQMIAKFLIVRHKSLDLPLGTRRIVDSDHHDHNSLAMTSLRNTKTKYLTTQEIYDTIYSDWKPETNHKGYYITGKLTSSIYRDDCFFDGPDPDMPVRGLRKYLDAASKLFDPSVSHAQLLSLDIIQDGNNNATTTTATIHNPSFTPPTTTVSNTPPPPPQLQQKQQPTTTASATTTILRATWKIDGVLRLPWKPVLPQWTGATYYYLDHDQLVYEHRETWDMSVVEAFLKTLIPQLADKLYS